MSSIQPKVLLASMPWTVLTEPSLGLGILSSQLNQNKIQNTVKHFNLWLLRYLKHTTYNTLSLSWALNDFLFTENLDKDLDQTQKYHIQLLASDILKAELPKHWKKYSSPEDLYSYFVKIRNEVIPKYLKDCIQYIKKSNATMVGFTCMFDQTFASISLAKELKKQCPDKLIVLGGYGVRNETGWEILKSFPWVDVIATGEGENIISDLAFASVDKDRLLAIPNIIYRVNSGGEILSTTKENHSHAMNFNGHAEYTHFFNDINELNTVDNILIKPTSIPIESSRGCWWGEKSHCVFCGIDEQTIKYKFLPSEMVLDTLLTLRKKHSLNSFRLVDYILPKDYYHTLLPALGKIDKKFKLSCEIKANLNKKIFSLLTNAGFEAIQPGIESFSSSVLKKMKKGVSGIQNILTLKLGKQYHIKIHYNLLFSLPLDVTSEYEEQTKILPLLYHLDPPFNFANTSITRHSPMYMDPNKYTLKAPLQYEQRYNVIFSQKALNKFNFKLENYCYYFEKELRENHELANYYYLLRQQVRYWKRVNSNNSAKFEYIITPNGIEFHDSRYSEEIQIFSGDDLCKKIFLLCEDSIISIPEIIRIFGENGDKESIKSALDYLLDKRAIYQEQQKIVGLATPAL